MNYGFLTGHPWGRHGYHNTGGGTFDLGDPIGLNKSVLGPSKGNQASKLGVDPLGLFYKPAAHVPTEAELAQQDEARKQGLRSQIDKMYGIDDGPSAPPPSQSGSSGPLSAFSSDASATVAGSDNPGMDPDAQAALKQMQADDASVSDATRSYYGDQLSRSAAAAERNNRFNLARQGLSGGSVDVDSNKELATDQALGATRIDTAARAAASSLDAQRENERLNAIGLVNSGAGQDAVNAAQQGLKTSLDNANSQQRTDLSSDLFAGFADNYALNNVNAANAALLARQNSLGAFFPTKPAGGNVTPSG